MIGDAADCLNPPCWPSAPVILAVESSFPMEARVQPSALDCSRLAPCVFWFSVGLLLGAFAIAAQGAPNVASLLRVGSMNPLIAQIERDLGPVHPRDETGHDGQLFYLIARDPLNAFGTAQRLAEFDNNPPRYRYRRIFYPLLAGGFGLFTGRQTLVGMILLTVVGVGLSAVATADLAHGLNVRGGVVLVAILNLGMLLSVMLLTSDALALGLALVGLALVGRRKTGGALVAFALAVLTKEVYAVVPLAVAAVNMWRRCSRDALVVAMSLLPCVAWTAWVWARVPYVPVTAKNLGVPLGGVLESVPRWPALYAANGAQIAAAVFAIFVFALAITLLLIGRNTLLRSTVVVWLAVAAFSTSLVWSIPTNVARAFAVLWPLGWLLWAERRVPGR
jgi:hypothetical protein